MKKICGREAVVGADLHTIQEKSSLKRWFFKFIFKGK